MRRIITRRRLILTAFTLILLFGVVALLALFLVRQGHFDRWLAGQLKTALTEYGVEAEVGSLNTRLRDWQVELKDLKLYPENSREPFATLRRMDVAITARQLAGFFGFGGKGQVDLRELTIEGLRATYKVDENGRSNLAGLHLPQRERRVDFSYSSATIELKDAEISYLDQLHKLSGTARNLSVTLSPDANGYTRVIAATERSDFIFDGEESTGIGLKLNARANEQGAIVESLNLNSPLVTADLKGSLSDWRAFAWQFDATADIRTREVAQLFTPQTRLSGTTRFVGKVEGKGNEYTANGKITSNDLVAEGVRIEGLSLNAKLSGKEAAYDAQHDVAIRQLEAFGYRINRFVASGKIAGSGEDFSWLGNLTLGNLAGDSVRASEISFRNALIKGSFTDPKHLQVKGRVSIPQLVTADVPVGNLTGDLTATKGEVSVPNFSGSVFGGTAKGSAKIRLDGRGASTVVAELGKLNLDQAGAVAANKRLPLRGTADGRVNLSWQGRDYKSAVGAINLQFTGATLKEETGIAEAAPSDPKAPKPAPQLIEGFPVSGALNLIASDRRLRLENTTVQTGATKVSVSGEIGWDRTGALDVALDAPNAAELKTLAIDLARAYGVAESQLQQFDSQVTLTDKLSFNGKVTGALDDPRVEGRFALGGLNVNDEYLGALAGAIVYEAQTLRVEEGTLALPEGGRAEFTASYPFNIENGATLTAKLDKFPLAATVRQFAAIQVEGVIIGDTALEGLPGAIRGKAGFKVAGAKFNDQAFEELSGQVALDGERIEVENLKLRSKGGIISGSGGARIVSGEKTDDAKSAGASRVPPVRDFRLKLKGENIDLGEIVAALSETASPVTGRANFELEAAGAEFRLGAERGKIFDQLQATITSDELRYHDQSFGKVHLTATGRASVAQLELTSELLGQSYTGAGDIDFGNPDFPINAAIELRETSLAPVFDLLAGAGAIQAGGTTSGQLKISGSLAGRDNPVQLEAALNQLMFDISDYQLTAQPPLTIRISPRQVDVGTVTLSGANTNLVIKGSVATSDEGRTDFSLSGDVNPKILQTFVPDLFADGLVKIEAAAKGSFRQPRFSGTATVQNGSLRSPDFPLALTRANGRVRFTADQAQIEKLTADVGTGKLELTGGAAFAGLKPERWRFQFRTSGVRVDYPRDTRTTLDGDLTLQGSRQLQVLSGVVNVRRAEYLAEANLFEFIERIVSEFSIAPGGAVDDSPLLPPTQFDIRVAADDSLIVRTKTLDLVASAALRLSGPSDDVAVGGRITITRGLIDDILKERYRIASGVIEFSGVSKKLPRLNIEAETEIAGYRVILPFTGQIDQIKIKPRSEPLLPENQVYDLIFTGQLPDSSGSVTSSTRSLAQTSANTLAQLATDRLSRSIESNVTGRLFGLNRFAIDPLLTGRGTDPTARITVGRRVTRDLSITYSTNVASNQDQVILIEYRASDRIRFVASRAQDGTFGLDVRLRKQF
jgi:translocation and assembly module TamB